MGTIEKLETENKELKEIAKDLEKRLQEQLVENNNFFEENKILKNRKHAEALAGTMAKERIERLEAEKEKKVEC